MHAIYTQTHLYLGCTSQNFFLQIIDTIWPSLFILIKRLFLTALLRHLGFPGDSAVKEPTSQCRRCRRGGFDPWDGKIP